MVARLKKGDTVIVISGKDKGKKGKILNISSTHVVVEKINIVHKHQKPTKTFQGGIIEKPAPLNLAKVMLVCPKCNSAEKVRAIKVEDKMFRKCAGCNEVIDKV